MTRGVFLAGAKQTSPRKEKKDAEHKTSPSKSPTKEKKGAGTASFGYRVSVTGKEKALTKTRVEQTKLVVACDKVFGSFSQQADFYNNAVKPIVSAVLSNNTAGTIFSYGCVLFFI